ncbi:hypothetical protein Aple_010860 [Acrocarpospora pleiomorpha]|uniref:Uncharacterized protein n=1 Tax=Acrocarpospora pleiomorpha TaxID=90975 RepID=A0A5M3XF31_9ACTN|nr:hypothetical protein [Acrocarpospora pleiomorpha]GES18191.1 hypothetical protein Aple_010860 [Acrocarpospora pleiomorpha]
MSFGFAAAGTPAAVIKAVRAQPGSGDTSQLDAVKAFVVSELESWPEGMAVSVQASGHHGQYGRQVTLTIQVINLVTDDPDEEV